MRSLATGSPEFARRIMAETRSPCTFQAHCCRKVRNPEALGPPAEAALLVVAVLNRAPACRSVVEPRTLVRTAVDRQPLTGQRGSWRGDRENSCRQWWRRG